ncbi:MAG: hypothetical protein J7578_06580 [Chitinophagaceae bacterium]|nr:hypothetical protein [Chitinophagaceae bacterium]
MTNASIKEQLHNYLEFAEPKKLRAIYAMVQEEIDASVPRFSVEGKRQLNTRLKNYQQGGKTVSAQAMNKRLDAIRAKRK